MDLSLSCHYATARQGIIPSATQSLRVSGGVGHAGKPSDIRSLWRVCEHHQVTHVVDFRLGSKAVAASGAVQYEGSTKSSRNGWIRFWIDASRGCKQTSMRKAILSHGRRCRIRREGSRALFGAAGRRRRRLVRGRRLSSPSLQPLAHRRLVGGRRLSGSGRACIKNKIRIRCAHD